MVEKETPKRFDVYLVNLDPTKGREIKKTRPCVVISPDEINNTMNTHIVAPMTTALKNYPFRVDLTFQKKKGQIALNQIRTVDRSRMVKKLGSISETTAEKTLEILKEMFT